MLNARVSLSIKHLCVSVLSGFVYLAQHKLLLEEGAHFLHILHSLGVV